MTPRLKLPLNHVITRLMSHQYEGAVFGMDTDALACFMEPGTGKTLLAIALCDLWKARRVVVISPSVMVDVWPEQIEEHAPGLLESVEWRFLSYDGLRLRRQDKRSTRWARRGEFNLIKWKPDVIICDEGHRLKNRGSRQSKMIRRIARNVERRVILTGTPIDGGYEDLWAQFDMLAPGLLGHRYREFEERYVRKGGYRGYQIIGYRHVNRLMEKIRPHLFVRKLADCIDLPSERHVVVRTPMKETLKMAYAKLHKTLQVEFEGRHLTALNPLTKLMRLHQMCGGFVDNDCVDRGKLNSLLDLTTDWKKPFIVFCRYLNEIGLVSEALQKRGLRVGVISGQNKKNRTAERRAFQAGERDALVIQSQSGIGITLTRATEVIFYSMDWSYITYNQNLHRVLRIGADKDRGLTYYYLVASVTHSVDREVKAALEAKQDLTDYLYARGISFFTT